MSEHVCKHVGLVSDKPVIVQKTNGVGKQYYIATARIHSLFGTEVDGECHGIGWTKELALQRLRENFDKLAESLWEI
jgi:hypothetical protein